MPSMSNLENELGRDDVGSDIIASWTDLTVLKQEWLHGDLVERRGS